MKTNDMNYFYSYIKSFFENYPRSFKEETLIKKYLEEHLKQIPKKLYKFRVCNNNNFQALKGDYIWAAAPKVFPDTFDCKLKFDFNNTRKIESWFLNHLGEIVFYYMPPQGLKGEKRGYTVDDYIDFQNKIIVDGRYSNSTAKRLIENGIYNISEEEKNSAIVYLESLQSNSFQENIKEKIISIYGNLVESQRLNQKLCSFTQNYKNHSLWENYAEKYTGFCIEYDLSKVNEVNIGRAKDLLNILPVNYRKNIPSLDPLIYLENAYQTKILGNKNINTDCNVDLIKQLLYKKSDYCYEEEWRILLRYKKMNAINFPYISAVYLGKDIETHNEEIINEICERKNIQLFKQVYNVFDDDFNYVQVF